MIENIANVFEDGTVFKNSGASHITTVRATAHITTEIPGLEQGMPIKIHMEVPPEGF